MNWWFEFLNYFFYTFHTALILFNLFGWLFKKTRKLHFFVLMTTLFSWTVLGIWKGFGYCFLTDWHYDILRKLGETEMPDSYIVFLMESFTGWRADAELANYSIFTVTVVILVCSVWVNFFKGDNTKGRRIQ